MGKYFVLAVLCLVSVTAYAQSNDDIKQKIINLSIRNYSGNCPCPYNMDSAGRKCGKRSAYSRPGGASPICYDSDVTAGMIKKYRELHR